MRLLILVLALATQLSAAPDTSKPWTRWWWLGSGVDKENLTRQLESFAAAGIGGVEICPIYGAKGYEERDLPFLSPQWTDMLDHTSRECERLGLGLDLTTGTGWPFGGPWVSDEMASHRMIPFRKDVDAGQVTVELPKGRIECLVAYPESGDPVDLSGQVIDGKISWQADGPHRIRGILSQSPIQKVKRAAPGGAGNVLDPFSPLSLTKYLQRFDAPLKRLGAPQPRAHFHDSFEYYGASWTPRLLEVFEERQGYDLRDQLPAFFGEGDEETVDRVAHDYRETLDFLHHAYLSRWNRWARTHGSLTRNQAHGSPGNLLDHYAVADIPETEIFRHVEDNQIPTLQFAASAAHLSGHPLVSAESFTWLGEHFQVKPAALKAAADFLWLGGVNHIFFHGIPYTPEEAGWPGWLFYASTHMGENGGLWRDLPAFNDYIHRVQQVLQSGRPDTAVLLYFPIHDLWSEHSEDLPLFTIHNQTEWLHGTPFHRAAMSLWENGIPCDHLSDRLLEKLEFKDGQLRVGELAFRSLVVPSHRHMPAASAAKLEALAAAGAPVAFLGDPPTTTPGMPGEALEFPDSIPVATDLLAHLATLDIEPEPMSGHGVRFVRRVTDDGHAWFLVNHGDEPIDAWVGLTTPFAAALFTDPANDRSGRPELRDGKLHLVLGPGESRLLRTLAEGEFEAVEWDDRQPAGEAIAIGGPWKVEFLDGGPEVPSPQQLDELVSWTEAGKEAAAFSGTARYTTTFEAEPGRYLLDLGEVGETCRVSLNGEELGRSFFPPHRFELGDRLKEGSNTLEVEVTNLAANHIAELDRRGVEWKAFHEINFVNIDYKPFDASGWKPLPSGLLGPVRLVPID